MSSERFTSSSIATIGAAEVPGNRSVLSHGQLLEQLGYAQKSSKGAPAYSRFVNRRWGRHLAAVAFRLGMTPNQVTAISAGLSLVAILMLTTVRPSWFSAVTIAVLLAGGYAFDAADGQLARLRGGGSFAGEWLDHMVDATKTSLLHVAVVVSWYRFGDLPPAALLIPLAFAVVSAVMFFGMTLNDQLRRHLVAAGGALPGPTTTSGVRSLAVIPTDYGVHCWVFVLLALPTAFFWAYTLLFVGCAGFMALAAVKWYRDMRALDAARTEAS